MLVQQVVKQSKSALEPTEVPAVATMPNADPAVLFTARTQQADPEGGYAGRHQQARATRGV